MAGKQAKILSEYQQDQMLRFMDRTRYPTRNKLILFLSVKAGLRAIEIAYLRWRNLLSSDGIISGQIIVEDAGSKGKRGGRTIPMHPLIRAELDSYVELTGCIRPNDRVIALGAQN
jgi:integrase